MIKDDFISREEWDILLQRRTKHSDRLFNFIDNIEKEADSGVYSFQKLSHAPTHYIFLIRFLYHIILNSDEVFDIFKSLLNEWRSLALKNKESAHDSAA